MPYVMCTRHEVETGHYHPDCPGCRYYPDGDCDVE